MGSPAEAAAGAVALAASLPVVGSAARAVARTPTNANANNMACLLAVGGTKGRARGREGLEEGGREGLEL